MSTARSKGIGEGKVVLKHVVRSLSRVDAGRAGKCRRCSRRIVTEQISHSGHRFAADHIDLANDTPVIMAGLRIRLSCRRLQPLADIIYGWLDHAFLRLKIAATPGARPRHISPGFEVAKISPPSQAVAAW